LSSEPLDLIGALVAAWVWACEQRLKSSFLC
jgi:hypothetical protein